jgi:hypothetical protein
MPRPDPLDRQMKKTRRHGAELTTQALWDQVAALADRLTPLHDRIKAFILARS